MTDPEIPKIAWESALTAIKPAESAIAIPAIEVVKTGQFRDSLAPSAIIT